MMPLRVPAAPTPVARFVTVLILAAPLIGVAAPAPKRAASVDGFWEAPAGRLQLLTRGNQVSGRLVSVNAGTTVKAGKQILTGSIDEDSFTADVQVGVMAPGCGSSTAKAFVTLLITKSGKLTGGVSSRLKCARSVSSVTLLRATDGAAPRAEAPVNADYDAQGKRKTAIVEDVRALLREGLEYMNEGRFEKGRELFQQALTKDATVGETYNGMGATYAARSEYATAVDWYKKGLEAAPGFGDLYYNLACAYAQQDKKSLALRYLKLAATKGYTDISVLDEDHELDPVRQEPEFVAIRKLMQGTETAPATKPAEP